MPMKTFLLEAGPRAASALLATLALSLGACGESEEEKVERTVEGYFDALSAADYGAACGATGDEFRSTLATYARETFPKLEDRACETVLERISSETDPRLVRAQMRLEVRKVEVDGDSADVDLAPGQRATLAKGAGQWKIIRLDFDAAR